MNRVRRACLAGVLLGGLLVGARGGSVTASVLSPFSNPDRAAMDKLYSTMLPEAQAGNLVAYEIAICALRGSDRAVVPYEIYRLPKPRKNSDPVIVEWRTQVEKKAEAGDMFFACALGLMNMNGSGMETNLVKGVEWLQKAAAAQSALGHLFFGILCEDGFGSIPADKRKAAKYYLLAGKLGLAMGWNCAGFLQRTSHALGPDGGTPKEYYEKAIAMNYPQAKFTLGKLYFDGDGVAPDRKKAVSLIRQAAKENSFGAKCFLANGYGRSYDMDKYGGWALLQPPAGKSERELSAESTALKMAFRRNQLDVAKSLIASNTSLYISDPETTTVMHAAVLYNQLSILDTALQKGGDLNARNDLGYTPLQLAVLLKRPPVIDYLVEKGAKLDACSAALADDPEMLRKVLAADPSQANSCDERGMTPLHFAALHRQLKNTELLLKSGANPNARNVFDETPLHSAISSYFRLKVTRSKSMESSIPEDAIASIIEALLAKGADINARDLDGNTPFIQAISLSLNACVPAVKLLIDRGADLKARNSSGKSGLHKAIQRSPDVAVIMIERGADVNEPDVLNMAAFCGDERVIDALVSHGADINEQALIDSAARNGKAPVVIAVFKKHGLPVPGAMATTAATVAAEPPSSDPIIWTIVSRAYNKTNYSEKALTEYMEAGLTNYLQMINTPSKRVTTSGLLPLHQAVRSDRYEIAKWLIAKGADVNAREHGQNGNTPLFEAISCGNSPMVKLLLENNANPNDKVNGVSPLKAAQGQKAVEIERLLLKYVASE